MSELMGSVNTINSAVRTLIFLAITCGVGWGGYVGYNNYVKPGLEAQQAKAELEQLQRQFEQQQADLTKTQQELTIANEINDRLETSLKLLKIDRRLANIQVLEKSKNDDGEPTLLVRFTEIDQHGNPLGASREFTLRGEKLYVDCWIVQFEDVYIEQSDILRSASLCVFKSIFGELDGPSRSFPLDSQSELQPGVYKDQRKSQFESQIWNDFWNVSNNPERQHELGIRANHGQANYVKGEEGMIYQVNIRASGSVSLEPLERKGS